ncbi:MAG: gliding motility-associated C-terminal domain-containing protein [Sphingobacteriia bacterium]|nr:gliding motility-associated C-terminal domain-containing protein [Sphingobacteriia bacterium]
MDQFLKDKFDDFEQTPSVSVWSKLDRSLRLKRYARFSLKIGLPLVVATIITLVVLNNLGSPDVLQPAQNSASLQTNQDNSYVSSDINSSPKLNSPANSDIEISNSSKSSSGKVVVKSNERINSVTEKPVTAPDVLNNSIQSANSTPSIKVVAESQPQQKVSSGHDESQIITPQVTPSASTSIANDVIANQNELPGILFGGTEIKQICSGEEIALIAPEGKSYRWDNGDIGRTIVVRPNESQDVTVLLTNWSDQQVEMHYRIEVLDCSIYIPRAFSPNGDGQNDQFLPLGDGISNYNMKIYSKQGELLFESSELNIGWDGRTVNGKQPFDVYVYRVSFNDVNGKIHLISGTFTLLP